MGEIMNQPAAFLECLRKGEKYNYPDCCVWQFAKELIDGKTPGQLRGLDNTGTFVPCDRCKKYHEEMIAKIKKGESKYILEEVDNEVFIYCLVKLKGFLKFTRQSEGKVLAVYEFPLEKVVHPCFSPSQLVDAMIYATHNCHAKLLKWRG